MTASNPRIASATAGWMPAAARARPRRTVPARLARIDFDFAAGVDPSPYSAQTVALHTDRPHAAAAAEQRAQAVHGGQEVAAVLLHHREQQVAAGVARRAGACSSVGRRDSSTRRASPSLRASASAHLSTSPGGSTPSSSRSWPELPPLSNIVTTACSCSHGLRLQPAEQAREAGAAAEAADVQLAKPHALIVDRCRCPAAGVRGRQVTMSADRLQIDAITAAALALDPPLTGATAFTTWQRRSTCAATRSSIFARSSHRSNHGGQVGTPTPRASRGDAAPLASSTRGARPRRLRATSWRRGPARLGDAARHRRRGVRARHSTPSPSSSAPSSRTTPSSHGADPFAGLRSSHRDLRRACEVQARSHVLHLREGYLADGRRPLPAVARVRPPALRRFSRAPRIAVPHRRPRADRICERTPGGRAPRRRARTRSRQRERRPRDLMRSSGPSAPSTGEALSAYLAPAPWRTAVDLSRAIDAFERLRGVRRRRSNLARVARLAVALARGRRGARAGVPALTQPVNDFAGVIDRRRRRRWTG